jgi:hypothetical protein
MNPRLKSLATLFGASLACVLAIGFPYWGLRYSQVNLPDALYGWGLLLVFVFSAAIRIGGTAAFLETMVGMALAVPSVVLLRVVYDTSFDPTSHNLWPFEIVIAAFVGAFVAALGTSAGSLVRWAMVR